MVSNKAKTVLIMHQFMDFFCVVNQISPSAFERNFKSHSAASEMPSADISNKNMETQSCFSCWLEKIRQIENAFTLS